MAYKNSDDAAAAKHRHYLANKDQYIARKNKRKQVLTDYYNEYKEGLSCINCDEDESCCIEFHHTDPEQKEGNVSEMLNCGSLKKLKEELAKCIPVCANCHKKHHAGIIKIRA